MKMKKIGRLSAVTLAFVVLLSVEFHMSHAGVFVHKKKNAELYAIRKIHLDTGQPGISPGLLPMLKTSLIEKYGFQVVDNASDADLSVIASVDTTLRVSGNRVVGFTRYGDGTRTTRSGRFTFLADRLSYRILIGNKLLASDDSPSVSRYGVATEEDLLKGVVLRLSAILVGIRAEAGTDIEACCPHEVAAWECYHAFERRDFENPGQERPDAPPECIRLNGVANEARERGVDAVKRAAKDRRKNKSRRNP